ncbi:hypothetical protein [Sphingomonas sp.]|jgi:hypothetical protein|uniref:hypothetical protein n=1 Tax=Sphingomonas sp. TaxID=28214 RepID=UPI002D7E9AB1|nr:hypothetical protein [Sphingomonas sp.]HEU0043723.1 hypothetical protein [Sphingomonas sp.]
MAQEGKSIIAPGGDHIGTVAMAFENAGGTSEVVDAAHPLPVRPSIGGAGSTPLTGTAAASATNGPFVPELGRAIWVTLSGSWSGTAQLLRSADGGATKLPITYSDGSARAAWTGAVNAAVTEETCGTATYYLQFTRNAGTLTYRVEQ